MEGIRKVDILPEIGGDGSIFETKLVSEVLTVNEQDLKRNDSFFVKWIRYEC